MADDLRDQIAEAIGPTMRIGLQDADLHDEPGAQRIEEWITWISDAANGVVGPELERLRKKLAVVEAENDYRIRREEYLMAAIERVRERLDALIAEGFGATTPTLRALRAALDTPADTTRTPADSHGQRILGRPTDACTGCGYTDDMCRAECGRCCDLCQHHRPDTTEETNDEH